MSSTSTQNESFESDSLSSPSSPGRSTVDSLQAFDSPQRPRAHKKSSKEHKFTHKSKIFWKLVVAVVGILVMFFARFNVPDNPIGCMEDKAMAAFQGLNDWIHTPGNELYRSVLLFACGAQIDLIFFFTLLHWVCHGRTGRLPMSIAVFYGIRAIVQSFWWSRYPDGFYWESPGFPSFVAPYGKASDFFFSGHSGFLVLMANEWHILGKKMMRNYCLVNLVYTIFILLVYQAHYSIDIFTGVFFADYVFGKINTNKETIDGYWKKFAGNVEKLTQFITSKVSGPELSSDKKNL